MQPLRVLVQMAQVSVPKMPDVIVWKGGSRLAGPNISMVHTFGRLQRKFIKLFTLCWLVCPAMHYRMGEEGSCPARPVQIHQRKHQPPKPISNPFVPYGLTPKSIGAKCQLWRRANKAVQIFDLAVRRCGMW